MVMPPIEWPTSTPGLAGAPLVVEHHPDLVAPLLFEAGTLKVIRAHAHTKPVREHDRQRGVGRTHLPQRQRHTVGGRDHAGAIEVEKREILCRMWVVDGHP